MLFISTNIAFAKSEWVYVAKVLDDDDKGIIVRRNGDAYIIEKGVGCISFWRYENKNILISSPGLFLGVGSALILPEQGQQCRIWDSSGLESWPTTQKPAQPKSQSLTILFVFAALFYTRLKPKKIIQYPTDQYIKKFGVLWDDNLNMRCNHCTTLLKNSSAGPPEYYCSNPSCNVKYILRTEKGDPLDHKEATDIIKGKSKGETKSEGSSESEQELSKAANAILRLFLIRDVTKLGRMAIYKELDSISRIKVQAGLDELCNAKLLVRLTSSGDYGLTERGRKILSS
jgi:hypothetical protein